MTKLISPTSLTAFISRRIFESDDDGLTHEAIMKEFGIGRTAARNHTKLLEETGSICRIRRVSHPNRWKPPVVYYTYHACVGKYAIECPKVKRDYLVEAFFGPA